MRRVATLDRGKLGHALQALANAKAMDAKRDELQAVAPGRRARHATIAAAAILLGLPAPLGATGVAQPGHADIDLQGSSITDLIRNAGTEEQLASMRLEIAHQGHEASLATRRKWARAFDARQAEIRAAAVSGRALS